MIFVFKKQIDKQTNKTFIKRYSNSLCAQNKL